MKLYYMPVSTFSQKVLIAFYEKDVSFKGEIVNLSDEDARKNYRDIYPLGKIPLLQLEDGHIVPESTIIIEWLENNFDQGTRLIPTNKDKARQTRFKDRMYDLYVNEATVTLLFQGWRPEDRRDPERIEKCKFYLDTLFGFMEKHFSDNEWAVGDEFTMADCSAAPALLLASKIHPWEDSNIQKYFERLCSRPSVQRIIEEATPYWEKMSA